MNVGNDLLPFWFRYFGDFIEVKRAIPVSLNKKRFITLGVEGREWGLGDQEDALDHFLLTLTSPFGQTVASFLFYNQSALSFRVRPKYFIRPWIPLVLKCLYCCILTFNNV